MVTLAEERLQRGRKAVFVERATAAADRGARRRRADPARRLQPEGREDRRRVAALHPGVPQRRRDAQFRQRRRACALQPGRRGDAGPHHPHQELAADRAARRRAASSTISSAAVARGGRELRRTIPRPISRRNNARVRRHQEHARSAAARRAGAGPRPVRARPLARRTRASPPTSPKPRSRPSPMPRRSGASSRSPKPTCSTWNTGRSNRQSSARRPRSRSPARSRRSPARAAPSARRPRRAFAAAGAEVALLDVNEAAATEKAKAIGGAALRMRCDVTDAASVQRGVRQGGRRPSAASTSWCRTRARRWQGRIGEVDEAILRESFELNFYGHQRVAQAAVRIMLAQGTGGCLLFNVSKQAVNPGPNFGPYGLPKAATLVPGAPIRARLRRRRHPRQRGQCRPHPLRPADRGLHRRARARRAA